MNRPQTALRRLILAILAAAVGFAATGCATSAPPVQEMSDARQAIAAAREAGAAEFDKDGLRRAELQLAEAEAQLQQRMYWDARKQALNAKESALAALLRSRSLRESEGVPASPAVRP